MAPLVDVNKKASPHKRRGIGAAAARAPINGDRRIGIDTCMLT